MPTDTKLNNLIINYLTQAQYDAIQTPNENELYLTPDNSTGGGGGASVSPCLNLMDMENGSVRTSITEEEKTNLEKGLYNSVLYADPSSDADFYSIYFPETANFIEGTFTFSKYNLSVDEAAGTVTISGSSAYGLTIGEKSADGTYPITIEKVLDAPFGGGGGGSSTSISFQDVTVSELANHVGKFENLHITDLKLVYDSFLGPQEFTGGYFIGTVASSTALAGVMWVVVDTQSNQTAYYESDNFSISNGKITLQQTETLGVIKSLPFPKKINSQDGYNFLSEVIDIGSIVYAGEADIDSSSISHLILGLSSNVVPTATGDEEYCHFDCIVKDMGIGRMSLKKDSNNIPQFKSFTTWLPPVTANSEGKALIVTGGNAQWTSIPESGTSYPIELQLDGSKQDLGIGQYNGKPGIYILSSPNNGIICEWKFDIGSEVITEQYDRILLYGVANVGNATSPNSITISGEAYVFKSATPRDVYYMGSGTRTLVQTTGSNYKIELANNGTTIGINSNGGIAGAIPTYGLLGAGKTQPSQLPRILSAQYCALRYDFKKTSSSTDTEKVTSSFFGRIIADNVLTPTKITLIGIFDNGMGKAVLEKNTSGVFESKTPIEYVEDINAITYSKARYKHTVTLKTSAGAILWTQTLSNSNNTPVDSYEDLKTLFGGELLAGYGEYAQLDLRGGTEATDKLIKADGTEATLASLGAIVYTDVCFLPK